MAQKRSDAGQEVLVLCPSPPSPEVRALVETQAGVQCSFVDLPYLRRQGLRGGLSQLRARHPGMVVVAGAPRDIALFGDYLVALAFAVPGARREIRVSGEPAAQLGLLRLLGAAARIAAGFLAGVLALARSTWRARRLARSERPVLPLRGVSRCLQLKPMLSYGASAGGALAHAAGVANAFARAGVEVSLLAAHEQPLVACPQRVVPPGFLLAFPFELNLHRYQAVFERAARAEAARLRPDFIYQRYGLDDLSGVRLRRETALPLVLEFNGSEVWAQRHWGEPPHFEALATEIERINLREADLVVVVSQALVDVAVELGAAPERVLFYPNGIDPSLFDPTRFSDDDRLALRRELGVPEDADVFTFVGTFGRWHGTDVLASAIRRLLDAERERLAARKVHFLFVGDGAMGPEVRRRLGPDLGAPFVTLAGLRPQDQTPRVLAASDVFLSPHVPNADGTPFVGSPTKLFEYMAMGRPIVASDLEQVGWVLKGWRPGEAPPSTADRSARAARLVEPGDVDALVHGIREAIEWPAATRQAMGTEARRLVLESFTWDKHVAAILSRLRAGAAASVERR